MNKLISSRQSGTATLSHSVISAQADWFTWVEVGGLHLVGNVQGGVDSGLELSGLEDDIDQQSRFLGEEGDIDTNECFTFQLFTSTLITREKTCISYFDSL